MRFFVTKTSGSHYSTVNTPPCEGAEFMPLPNLLTPGLGYWTLELLSIEALMALNDVSHAQGVIITADVPNELKGICAGTLEIYDDYRE